ncbi:MAG TPA: carboxylesterase family protein [Clostridiales bacterium]|nr:carboxylesterase family protein [Clostridiales bacterium]
MDYPAGKMKKHVQEFGAYYLNKYGINNLPFSPNVDGYMIQYNNAYILKYGFIKDIPVLLGSNKDDIFVTNEKYSEIEKGSLYHGCINWANLAQGRIIIQLRISTILPEIYPEIKMVRFILQSYGIYLEH